MSQTIAAPETSGQTQLAKLCVTIRGKLQFMDYLVRAAVADVDRFQDETDAGTRIFIKQLIEMHAANLALESENMRLVGDLCNALDAVVNGNVNGHGPTDAHAAPSHHHGQNGDAE